MAYFYLNFILYFAIFLTFSTVSIGGNKLSKLLRTKRESNSSDFSDFLRALLDQDVSNAKNYASQLNADLAPLLEGLKDEFDKYPDNVNKTYSNVKEVNGSSIETNKTVFKETNNDSFVGYIAKTQSINGKPKIQTIIHYKGENDDNNQDTVTEESTK